MKNAARIAVLFLVVSVVSGPMSALASDVALGFTEAESDEEPIVVEPTFEPGMEPAVVTPPHVDSTRDQPWTARYIAPALVVLGILSLLASAAFYAVRVRGRYEVID